MFLVGDTYKPSFATVTGRGTTQYIILYYIVVYYILLYYIKYVFIVIVPAVVN